MKHLKTVNIIFVFLAVTLLLYCTEKPSADAPANTAVPASFAIPEIEEDNLKRLFEDQLRIMRFPDNPEYRKIFITQAYFKPENALVTFGTARKSHPQTGNPVNTALLKRAALLDARRWAAYSLQWIENVHSPDFGKIQTESAGVFKEINTFSFGDSLVIAIATKVNEKGN